MQPSCKAMKLPPICSITEDCLKITCRVKFLKKQLIFGVTIDNCNKPPSITVHVQVPHTRIGLVKTVRSSQQIPVPGFGFTLRGAKGGVFVDIRIRPAGTGLSVEVGNHTAYITCNTRHTTNAAM